MRMLVRIVVCMEANTNSGKVVTVYTRGCDLSVVSQATKDAWKLLYRFTAMQVWTWRGGEAIVCKDWDANYGRGEVRVVVRTGGTKRGAVRVLFADNFLGAMQQLGITFRISTGMRPKRERTASELNRAAIARAARKLGNHFRTMRARPARVTMNQEIA